MPRGAHSFEEGALPSVRVERFRRTLVIKCLGAAGLPGVLQLRGVLTVEPILPDTVASLMDIARYRMSCYSLIPTRVVPASDCLLPDLRTMHQGMVDGEAGLLA